MRRAEKVVLYCLFGVTAVLAIVETSSYTFPAPFLTIYLKENGYGLAVSGAVFASYAVGAVLTFHGGGVGVAKFGCRSIILASTASLTLVIAVPAASSSPYLLGACRYLQGVSSMFLWSGIVSFTSQFVQKTGANSDECFAIVMAFSPLGTAIGPILGTLFSGLWGPRLAYLGLAGIMAFLLVLTSVLLAGATVFASQSDEVQVGREAAKEGFVEMVEVDEGKAEECGSGAPPDSRPDQVGSSGSRPLAEQGQDLLVSETPGESTAAVNIGLFRALRVHGVFPACLMGALAGANLCWLEPVLAPELRALGVSMHTARVHTSTFFAVLSLSMFLTAYILGWISGKLNNRWWMLASSSLISAGTCFSIPWLFQWPYINGSAVFLGIVVNMVDAYCLTEFGQTVPEVHAFFIWMYYIGMAVGPLLSAVMTRYFNFEMACYIFAAANLTLLPMCIYMLLFQSTRGRRRSKDATDDKVGPVL